MTLLDPDRIAVVKPGGTYVGKQGFTYGAGASAETVGATKICMNVLAGLAAVDITVHDPIIVGKDRHTSFKASGLI